ncbi:Nucleotidylyl transferase [Ceraceosorus guamensis]|uniref:Nucleotidylyl transferase n=1 Tax=Ceraceosorus guamensis TaxID=1522189 RepID=A0A316W8P6_9BASI|nr:Nucleotidylyl transferase [Ceraceosorus guamensis]PWN46296.1 Nucleotidylyl transferase [Ceraceosorus guamensis]
MSSRPAPPAGAGAPSSSSAQAPLARMTDATAGPGPGPASTKLAALSIDSYHLDSPPFTGTAVGGPPLAEAGAKLAASRNTETPKELAQQRVGVNGQITSASPLSNEIASTSSDSAASSGGHEDEGQGHDGDVPQWLLDSRRHSVEAGDSSQSANASPLTIRPTFPYHSASRAFQPSTSTVRESSPHSSSTTTHTAASSASRQAEAMSITTVLSQQERQGRPAYAQTEDVDGIGQESASHPADAYDELDVEELGVASYGEVPRQAQGKADYVFPRHRLPTRMRDESKIPLVIVACGSFSPPTYLHLRIFEMAKDQVIEEGKYELLGGYYSPVSDYYKKDGLAKATHRVRMCELAVEKTSTWLMVDAWESLQDEYQRTAVVLDHFNEEINGGAEGGVMLADGSKRRIRIMLLAGGDLIQSMGEPGVWAEDDLHHILGRYGCMIVERTGADVWSFLLSHDLLWKYRRNLNVVTQVIYDDVSSSKIRLFIRRGKSIRYLLPQAVVHYMAENQLVST